MTGSLLKPILLLALSIVVPVALQTVRGAVGLPFPTVVDLAIGAALAVAGFATLIPRLRSDAPAERKSESDAPAAPVHRRETEPAARKTSLHPHLAGQEEIEQLFLNAFRGQVGASRGTPGSVEFLEEKAPGAPSIYELRLQHGDNEMTRRMTMKPIGGRTRGKSQCFFVIYDSHMVVKIPPSPIRDWDHYLKQLRREALIQEKMAPKKCVIPNVSVLLKKVNPFTEVDALTDRQQEERYIHLLENEPRLREYLKIDDRFVFFMDFSEFYFLSYVTGRFHDLGHEIADEVRSDIDRMTDEDHLETKYGPTDGLLWPAIRTMYREFRDRLEGISIESDQVPDLSEHQGRELFHLYLAGQYAPPESENGRADTTPILRQLEEMTAANQESVTGYRQRIERYVGRRSFNIHKAQMGELTTNLLSLLAALEDRGIAIRDLKPDNLLVAGDPANYPHFLSSAKEFSIGLIDLETAVDLHPQGEEKTVQPQLGGTPLYATPSHFFDNQTLELFYRDLDTTLHLQDWHAMVAIVFEVVTGEHLFQRSAGQITRVMRQVMDAISEEGKLQAVYNKVNGQFWETALREFSGRSRQARDRLAAMQAMVPEKVRKRMLAHNTAVCERLERRVQRTLESHPLLKRPGNRDRLKNSTREDLVRLRDRQKAAGASENREQLLAVLDELIRLKSRAEKLAAVGEPLSRPYPRMALDTLLEQMFSVVSGHMYPDSMLMGSLPAPGAAGPPDAGIDSLRYTFTVRVPSPGRK